MDVSELYQSLILDHNRSPRNKGELAGANRVADGRNPMCGDQLRVWLRVDGDRIADVAFLGKGCAISQASASLMTTVVKGKTRAEAEAMFDRFHDLVTGKPLDDPTRCARRSTAPTLA
jgi:nitrogen fixation NifU-like protein